MKILLVFSRSLGREDVNYNYLFPLGLAYISSVLKKAKYHVDILNLNHKQGKIEEVIHKILSDQWPYDFVCTGGLSPFYRQIKEIIEAIRRHQSAPRIILGGGLISSEPELMFKVLNPDFIVYGEGEKAIIDLFECIKNKGDLSHVLGIGYRDADGNIVCNKPQPAIMDLDSLPWPDFDGFEFENYLDNTKPTDQYFYDLYDSPRIYPIVCSRSCPYKCTFCFHPLGNKYRQRSIDSVMKELEFAVKRYRLNVIAIYDELFSYNKERVYEFCRRFKNLQKNTPWEMKWCCQMRVDDLDEEFLKTMKGAGCYMVSYGFESYSPAVLKSMKKHIQPEQIINAVNLTLKNNISIQGNFIFGDKAETFETTKETLNYWKQNNYAGIMLGFISPYPGTELYNHCLEKGIIKDKLDFIENHIDDIMNMTDQLTDEEFKQLKLEVFKTSLKYSIYATPISIKKTAVNNYGLKFECPHCHEVLEYNNCSLTYRWIFNLMIYCRSCRRRFFLVSRLYRYAIKSFLLLQPIMGKRLNMAAFNTKNTLIRVNRQIKRLNKKIKLLVYET